MNSNLINLESILDLSGKLLQTNEISEVYNLLVLSLQGKLGLLRAAIIEIEDKKVRIVLTKGKFIEDLNNEILINLESISKSEISFYNQNSNILFSFSIPNTDCTRVFLFGKKLSGNILSEEELAYLKIVIKIADISIQNIYNRNEISDDKKLLSHKNFVINDILHLNKEFSSITNKDDILKLFSLSFMGQTLISKFALILLEDYTPHLLIDRIGIESDINLHYLLNSADLLSKYCDTYIPLMYNNKEMGILLIKLESNQLSPNKELYIDLLTSITLSSLENVRLIQEEIKKKTIENELNLALEIQRDLLPKEFIENENYSVYGKSIASRYVAGDYFDILEYDEDNHIILIADISGKGLPASLLMANFQAALKILVSLKLSLEEIVIRLNKLVFDNTSADRFVTFFIGKINFTTRELHYINAGHNRPIYFDMAEHKRDELSLGGPILGVFEESPFYKMGSLVLSHNSLLLLYTDGAIEAENDKGRDLGLGIFTEIIERHIYSPTKKFVEDCFADILEFSSKENLYDDITLFAIKFH